MNVVIDCNIFISAILSQNGLAVEILKKALQRKITPYFGEKLFCEYKDVLHRKHIIDDSKLTYEEVDELFDALLSVSKWTDVYYLFRPNLKDESDNHLIELAVASNSQYIITHNKKDFFDCELKFNIQILNAQEFLQKEFSL